MPLGTDSISMTVTNAFDAASGTTSVGLMGLIGGIFGTAILLWAAYYSIRTMVTSYAEQDGAHFFMGIFVIALVVFSGLYIISRVLT